MFEHIPKTSKLKSQQAENYKLNKESTNLHPQKQNPYQKAKRIRDG